MRLAQMSLEKMLDPPSRIANSFFCDFICIQTLVVT